MGPSTVDDHIYLSLYLLGDFEATLHLYCYCGFYAMISAITTGLIAIGIFVIVQVVICKYPSKFRCMRANSGAVQTIRDEQMEVTEMGGSAEDPEMAAEGRARGEGEPEREEVEAAVNKIYGGRKAIVVRKNQAYETCT